MIMSLPQVGWRTAMINSIPTDLKIATGAGIGMFLSIIGLREMGWIRDDGATLVNIADTEKWGATSYGIPDGFCLEDHYDAATDSMVCDVVQDGYLELGSYGLHQEGAIIGMLALIAIAVLMARGIRGAMIYGIIVASVYGWAVGASDPYNFYFEGAPGWGGHEATAPALASIVSMPSMPETTLFAAFGDAGMGALEKSNMGDFLLVMIAFLFVDIFDTSGTLYSVGRQAGYVDENDELMNSNEAFMSDAAATIVGAAFGTSTTTTYIESAAGVEDGGKTGLTAVTVGVLMLSGLLFAGLFKQIPTFAAAPALVIIGAMMMRQAADIDWSDTGNSVPAFITMVMMPFTYSIAAGIAWGIISYVLINAASGKHKNISMIMWGLAIAMILFYGNIVLD
jgi:AGZA family xanthine/uracil permease-like MFS transporter